MIGTLFLIHNERPEPQVEKGFPQTFRVKGGGQEK